jgi:simple sugar transport system ATP-binding protein
MAVYVISSEIDELIALAHRISVMRDRMQVRMLEGDVATADTVLASIAEMPGAPT